MRGVADILNGLSCKRINLIDVGCFGSGDMWNFPALIPGKEVISLGIDPIRYVSHYPFTHFVQVAIRNCQPTMATFYQYNSPSCNSLLKMTPNITHDKNERDSKWYAERIFEKLEKTIEVPVLPLSAIIEQYGLSDSILHFVKIDAQGVDFEVFLSMGEYIKNCLFFQMETVTSHSKDIVLYEGQTIYEEERPVIEGHGFEFFSEVDYGAMGASPESDVIYLNTKLLEELQHA